MRLRGCLSLCLGLGLGLGIAGLRLVPSLLPQMHLARPPAILDLHGLVLGSLSQRRVVRLDATLERCKRLLLLVQRHVVVVVMELLGFAGGALGGFGRGLVDRLLLQPVLFALVHFLGVLEEIRFLQRRHRNGVCGRISGRLFARHCRCPLLLELGKTVGLVRNSSVFGRQRRRRLERARAFDKTRANGAEPLDVNGTATCDSVKRAMRLEKDAPEIELELFEGEIDNKNIAEHGDRLRQHTRCQRTGMHGNRLQRL